MFIDSKLSKSQVATMYELFTAPVDDFINALWWDNSSIRVRTHSQDAWILSFTTHVGKRLSSVTFMIIRAYTIPTTCWEFLPLIKPSFSPY